MTEITSSETVPQTLQKVTTVDDYAKSLPPLLRLYFGLAIHELASTAFSREAQLGIDYYSLESYDRFLVDPVITNPDIDSEFSPEWSSFTIHKNYLMTCMVSLPYNPCVVHNYKYPTYPIQQETQIGISETPAFTMYFFAIVCLASEKPLPGQIKGNLDIW